MYKLEDKEFDFDRVIVRDALAIKSAIGIMAKDNASIDDNIQADTIISGLALKYLKVKVNGQWNEGAVTEEYLGLVFSNEFAIIEIIAKFQERVSNFIQALPSFQSIKAKRK